MNRGPRSPRDDYWSRGNLLRLPYLVTRQDHADVMNRSHVKKDMMEGARLRNLYLVREVGRDEASSHSGHFWTSRDSFNGS